MIRYLSRGEVSELYRRLIAQSGGSTGLRDAGALESALAQPQMSFDNQELYPGVVEKAAVLGFCLIQNHPFLDGNKRIGHLAMETFLVLNGWEIIAAVTEQEEIIMAVAAGRMDRQAFTKWLETRVQPKAPETFLS